MAVVSHVPTIPVYRSDSLRCEDLRVLGTMAGRRETAEVPMQRVIEDIIYVAVGKKVKESKNTLLWALQNSCGKRICIFHVHQPAKMIPLMGTEFPVTSLQEQEVRAYRAIERQSMHKLLGEYLLICRRMGVQAEKLHIEMDCIEDGIMECVSRYGIRKLVMGAAADKHYSRRMIDLKSRKAIQVRLRAPVLCQIWFICKGHLIHTRESCLDVSDMEAGSLSLLASPNTETGRSNSMRSQSVTYDQNNEIKVNSQVQDLLQRVRSTGPDRLGGRASAPSSPDCIQGLLTPRIRLFADGSSDEWGGLSRRSPSQCSGISTCSSSREVDVAVTPLEGIEGNGNGLEICTLPQPKDLQQASPPSVLDGSIDDDIYEQLEQAMSEAENSRREAFEEAVRRGKAEKEFLEAMRKLKAAENLYADELKQRIEIDEERSKQRDELENNMKQREQVMEELQVAENQKALLESQIAESDYMVNELEEKIISAVELLQNYKKEQNELQIERDIALKEAENLRKGAADASTVHIPQFFSEFSFSEIEEATHNFDPSHKIGEGGYGSIYKGVLRHTQVAIKMLHSHSMQGPSEYQQEVDVLSKLRHPNLITLVGSCPDAWSLIYEYLPNGSLEDRLSCKDNTSPLSWQTRIRIVTELCSVLFFLHSSKPHSIVHGDLKPANILLDANHVSKLSDFGICRLISQGADSSNNTTLCCKTDPKGTFVYMDPEFLATGELTPKSDVYSFGIILLRLLTGRPALGITKEVQYALDKDKLTDLLDPLAGDWPFVQAEQLARLALRCCDMSRKSRPDLGSDVWKLLEPMRASCGGSSSLGLGFEEQCQPPAYFICPIFQEIMQDPHVCTDGYTYEAEALKGWLDSGHDTSPMTNNKLAHKNLVPNLALRSAIQEWLQQHCDGNLLV